MCIQRNFCYTGLALLGIDDDNAVGCAATVDGCRGGILQNLDVINVVRRQIVDIIYGYTVNHIKRTVATVKRCGSANTYSWRCARLAIGLAYLQTGCHSLHALQSAYDGTLLQIFRRDRRNSRCNILPFYRTITNCHHFVKRIGVFLHGNLHAVGSFYGQRLKPYIRETKTRTAVNLERKLPVDVSCRAICSSLHLHSGAHYRLILLVNNLTCHLHLLGKGRR